MEFVRKPASHQGSAWNVAFVGDGAWLLSGGDDGVILHGLGATATTRRLHGHQGPVYAVAGSSDGRWAMTAGADRVARIWKLPSGDPGASLRGHEQAICAVQFLHTGDALTLDVTATLRRFDAEQGTELGRAKLSGPGFEEGLRAELRISPDGTLALLQNDGAAYSVALPELQLLHYFNSVSSAFRADGSLVVWNMEGEFVVYDPRSGHEISRDEVSYASEGPAVALPSNEILYWTDGPTLWDSEGKNHVDRNRYGDIARFTSFVLAPGARHAASSHSDGSVRLWDIGALDEVAFPQPAASPSPRVVRVQPRSVEAWVSPIARPVPAAFRSAESSARTVCLGAFGEPKATHRMHISCSPERGVLLVHAVGPKGRRVHTFDLATGARLRKIVFAPEDWQSGKLLALTPDALCAISGHEDGSVCIWDVTSDPARRDYLGRMPEEVWSAALSADGAVLATGDEKGNVHVWDLTEGKLVAELEGHAGVTTLALSADGTLLFVGPDDSDAVLYRTTDPATRTTLGPAGASSAAFSPDGASVAVSERRGGRVHATVDGRDVTPPGYPGGVPIFTSRGLLLCNLGTEIVLWDPALEAVIDRIDVLARGGTETEGLGTRANAVAVVPDGSAFFVGTESGLVLCFELVSG